MDLLPSTDILWVCLYSQHVLRSHDQVRHSLYITSVLMIILLCSVFVGVSERRLAQGSSRRLRERQRVEDDLKGYHKWIKQARTSQLVYVTYCHLLCVSVCLVSDDEHVNEIKTRKGKSHYYNCHIVHDS